MKVVSQQTIRECVGDRLDVFCIQIQEILVIALLNENILAVVAAVVDVVVSIVEQRGRAGHGFILSQNTRPYQMPDLPTTRP